MSRIKPKTGLPEQVILMATECRVVLAGRCGIPGMPFPGNDSASVISVFQELASMDVAYVFHTACQFLPLDHRSSRAGLWLLYFVP